MILFSKADIHIFINSHNNVFLDIFFKIFTFFGDGIFIVIASVLLLFKRINYGACSLGIYLGSGILVQLFKKLILPDAPRPSAYLKNIYDLHFIEGIKMYSSQSFPSGHTASAFGLFFLLAIVSKNHLVKVLCLIAALLIGYSRMYLSLHFLLDVTVGSFIGVISTVIIFYYFEKIKHPSFNKPLFIKK